MRVLSLRLMGNPVLRTACLLYEIRETTGKQLARAGHVTATVTGATHLRGSSFIHIYIYIYSLRREI
jgi:hypothetical protein